MSAETCHRCNLEMLDDGEWFTCPCCGVRGRGIERQRARHEAHMAEMGMNEDEYTAWAFSQINTRPLSEAAEAGLQRRVAQMAAEWKPACEHDTDNPYAAGQRDRQPK